MTTSRSQRGLTILEATIALVVMLVGAAGLVGLNMTAMGMTGDARHLTRATAIAQDLVNQIELWEYTDSRLTSGAHSESELTPTNWAGIPATQLAGRYERTWTVTRDGTADDTNGNTVADAARVRATVRWPHGAGFRDVTLVAIKPDPREAQ
jgi:Tfp pilus assembly protein PilV